MKLATNAYGLAVQPTNALLGQLAESTDVILFGDTKHSNPAVKQTVFDMLGQLKKHGVSKLWLELDKKRQPVLDELLASNPPVEQILAWVPAKNNKETIANGIHRAHQLEMAVGLVDDKSTLNQFRADNPAFVELQQRYRQLRADGKLIVDAEAAVQTGMDQNQRVAYELKKFEWQTVRDSADKGFAERIAASAPAYPKQAVIIGDGHFNTQNDVDEMLNAQGVRNVTVHVSENMASYGEYLARYMDRTPDDDQARNLPDLIYFVDQQKFADPEHPRLMQEARKAYQLQKMDIKYSMPIHYVDVSGAGSSLSL